MTEDKFQEIVEEQIDKIEEILIQKDKEYTRNQNRLHTFDIGSTITNQTREEVIWGFALKHFISIQDIRNDVKEGKLPSKELLNEKYTDLINYLIIEKASILDKIENKNK